MKFIFSVLMLVPFLFCHSQDMGINLSAKGEKLSVLLDDNNSNRTFIIKKTNIAANNYFTAVVINEVIDTSWKRSFTIHNSGDSEIASLKYVGTNNYCISLNELIPKLQTGNQYYLYTIALPKNPKKQMLIKVVRRMVCKIIKN